ncbi:hypothetical protein D2Q93_01765 [Alicyclobacillaceae bacterium I2511]|nr:hypothetical protein D2Q93_01765 [Alicyclobacillaceae bacterium I2511]
MWMCRGAARGLMLSLSTSTYLWGVFVPSLCASAEPPPTTVFSPCSISAMALAQTQVTVELRDNGISPAFLRVSAETPVYLRVVNQGGQPHNLVIPDFYIFTNNLNPHESIDVSFTPDKAGVFPFYSDTGGKPEPGLRGFLHVSKG